MKKSDLRAIILEELEKSNISLLVEKFASPVIADINKRIGREGKDLWTSSANTYGIAWDQVRDEHVSDTVNPKRNVLNIFFVAKGTKNPYHDGWSSSSEFYSDGLLGMTIGKKVIGFTGRFLYSDPAGTKKSKKVNTEPHNSDKVGSGVDNKVWNFKRMLEISTEVFSIDLDVISNWNREVQGLRDTQKSGAIAMKKNAEILKDNKSRYRDAISALKDNEVKGKELDIIMSHIEEAEKNLSAELKRKMKDTKLDIVYSGWDNPFKLAVNTYENMINKLEDFKRYTAVIKRDSRASSYYSDRLTEAAKEVKELKANFDKKLASALASKEVKIYE